MKALVFNNVVQQVEPTEFEVHPNLVWVDCSNDVKAGFTFENGVFIPPIVTQHPKP
jgi:hypothetical protein